MIEAQQLTKWYGPTRAIDSLNFAIDKGQIVGFLGPNGAGKSTTLRILTGYIPPTSGNATIAGKSVLKQSAAARLSIGYLPEHTPLYPEMRVEEFLHFRGKLFKMKRADRKTRIDTVCDQCGLSQLKRRLIGQLSKGNRQRVGIAQALLHEPPILILDEPTSGLDPNQISAVRDLIAGLREKHTILLSSHILPEVEKVADRVLIIAGGRIVAEGTPADLRKSVVGEGSVVVETKADPSAVSKLIAGVDGVADVKTQAVGAWCRAYVTPRNGRDIRQAVGSAIHKNNWEIRELRHEAASLEQFFVQITSGAQD